MKRLWIAGCLMIMMYSCITYRTLTNGQPHVGETIFPSLALLPTDTAYYLPASKQHAVEHLIRPPELSRFLRRQECLAFLVIHQDTIVEEYYLYPELKQEATEIFSLTKSFVSTAVGIAYEEGFIESLSDPLGKYLPDLPPSYHPIRIVDLLDMRTGIKTTFLNTARLYYSNNLDRTCQCMIVEESPGQSYRYSNQATQLLVKVVEQCTKQNFIDYFIEKIWLPLRMENTGFWSLDSEKHHTPRGFAGLCLTARDIAKLGLLYLHDGFLYQQQILPASWVQTVLSPAEEHRISPETYYHLHWKILTPGEEFMAKGMFGQYLYVNKKTNTVIVRLGFKNTSTNWLRFFRTF